LPSGTYDFCVSVFVDDENKTYEQCFTIVIEAGTSLAGKTSVKNNKVTVDISQGTAPFKLFINNNLVLTTMNTSFEIDIEDGDKIQIKSSIDCEGVLLKDINIISEIKAYPNPTKGLFEITFPIKQKEVRIDVFNIHSQLISSKNYSIYNSKAQLNIENNATGIYIVKVYLDEKPAIFKIVKH